ncbi:MAG TPA: penicillin acylase family protein [Verrucomicrobiota bacterium]|nr:penicillin acylase family protein [Verrucomicrobiota bacterium]HNU53220.1 penicillin acylase family protein [Verrucomicrobiota bacterium]
MSKPTRLPDEAQQQLVREVCVRLAERSEWPRLQRLLKAHHYLGSLKPVGERLAYVAGDRSGRWWAREAVRRQRLGYYESLDGFPALDDSLAVPLPALHAIDGGTIGCQTAQSYTQWVPMHDPDQAQSLLPIDQSERPNSPSRTSTLALWSEGALHPAPLSRGAIDRLAVSQTRVAP